MSELSRTVRIGDADVTRVGLGTNRLTNTPEHVAFIQAASKSGLGMIDTAHLYAGGQSEETIGAALGGGNAPAIVATKGGFGAGEGRPDILRDQIESSLRRLRTQSIALYYMHRIHPDTPLGDSLGVVREYMERGQIRHVGISDVGIEQIEAARAIMPITAVQNQYSLSQRKWDDVLDYCTREGIVFVPFHPLHVDSGAELQRIAKSHQATTSQISLAWLLRRSPMMLPIPGTLSLAHAKENLAALDIEISDEEFAALD